jgi:hypothetical protein
MATLELIRRFVRSGIEQDVSDARPGQIRDRLGRNLDVKTTLYRIADLGLDHKVER